MAKYPKLEAIYAALADVTLLVRETTASATVTVVVADTTSGAWGGYFLTNSTTTASALLRAIQSALTDNATLSGRYSVTVDDDTLAGTGKVTIGVSGVTSFSLVWSATSQGGILRSALGFSTDLNAGSASYTGAYSSRYVWLPNVGRTAQEGPDPLTSSGTLGLEDSDLIVTQSSSGSSKVITFNRRQEARMAWRNVLGLKMQRENEAVTNESLQTMWEVMQDDGTMTFAYYPDRSVDTVSVALVAMAKRFEPAAEVDSWSGAQSLWQFSWNCLKKV